VGAHADAQLGLAICSFRKGQEDEALALSLQAAKQRPYNALALTLLAVLLERQGRLAQALEYLESALKVVEEQGKAKAPLDAIESIKINMARVQAGMGREVPDDKAIPSNLLPFISAKVCNAYYSITVLLARKESPMSA